MTKPKTVRSGGRRSVVPSAAAIKPRIDSTGLVLTARSEDGKTEKQVSLSEATGSLKLRQEVVQCLARLNGPNGSWKSVNSVVSVTVSIRHSLRWDGISSLQSLDELTPELWSGWVEWIRGEKSGSRAQTRNGAISGLRTVLLSHPTLTAETREALGARYHERAAETEREFYTVEEYKALQKAAMRSLRSAHSRITSNWEFASLAPSEVNEADRERYDALCLLASGKKLTKNSQYRAIGAWDPKHSNRLVRSAKTLFNLNTSEALAAAVAIVCESGENLSVVMNRTVPSTVATSGDESITILDSETDKPRRGATRRFGSEKSNAKRGLGKVLSLILESTEPARSIARSAGAPPNDTLIIYVNAMGRTTHDLTISGTRLQRTDADWLPDGLEVNFQKLHRTVLTRILGKSTFNTPETFVREYFLRDPQTQEQLRQVAAKGIQSLFDTAKETVVQLLTHEEAEKAGLLHGGEENFLTPTGMGCRDCDHNPNTGKPCSDPWLACLGCSNAFAVTDHLPSLVCVYDILEALREASSEEVWRNRYQVAWARLTVILDSLNEAQWERARTELTPEQRAMAEAAVLTREYEI